jgi:hypothetical protein
MSTSADGNDSHICFDLPSLVSSGSYGVDRLTSTGIHSLDLLMNPEPGPPKVVAPCLVGRALLDWPCAYDARGPKVMMLSRVGVR